MNMTKISIPRTHKNATVKIRHGTTETWIVSSAWAMRLTADIDVDALARRADWLVKPWEQRDEEAIYHYLQVVPLSEDSYRAEPLGIVHPWGAAAMIPVRDAGTGRVVFFLQDALVGTARLLCAAAKMHGVNATWRQVLASGRLVTWNIPGAVTIALEMMVRNVGVAYHAKMSQAQAWRKVGPMLRAIQEGKDSREVRNE